MRGVYWGERLEMQHSRLTFKIRGRKVPISVSARIYRAPPKAGDTRGVQISTDVAQADRCPEFGNIVSLLPGTIANMKFQRPHLKVEQPESIFAEGNARWYEQRC